MGWAAGPKLGDVVRKLLPIIFVVALAMLWSGWLTRTPQTPPLPMVHSKLGSKPDSSTHDSAKPSSSGDNNCTGDCRGHQAGYDWAETRFVRDKRDCDFAGEHSTFAGGCRDYVDRQNGRGNQSEYRRPRDDENDTSDSDNDDQ